MEITIFYSWQSDLPDKTNRRLIREALRAASSKIEDEKTEKQLQVILDEATRNTSGSPNIPATIMAKIEAADIFVCDITTINQTAPSDHRRVANPNVLFELGYAVAHLGWDRIILLFNTHFGKFPDDLPFDIDRHRASPYTFVPLPSDSKLSEKEIAAKKEPLCDLAYTAVKAVIDADPMRPDEKKFETPEEIKRRKDVVNLQWIMSTIHIPTLDLHIDELPDKIYINLFHFWECFNGVFRDSRFHIYDPKLKSLIDDLHRHWDATVSFGERYSPSQGGRHYIWTNSRADGVSAEATKDRKKQEQNVKDLYASLKALLEYLRTDYLEIDIDSLSKKAWEDYVEFEKRFLLKMKEFAE